jgi:hypothetical protein
MSDRPGGYVGQAVLDLVCSDVGGESVSKRPERVVPEGRDERSLAVHCLGAVRKSAVPYGTASVSCIPLAVNCQATITRSRRDKTFILRRSRISYLDLPSNASMAILFLSIIRIHEFLLRIWCT